MSNWKNYLATGVPVKNGAEIPLRKDIFDLSDEEMFLYVEGLRRFQEKPDKDDPLSYYQIAGIHGLPYTTWPNQAWNKDIKQVVKNGFCTHSSILFVTWHRPFLALYESTLYAHVNAVANGLPESASKAKYQQLAQGFRIPYWDWARRGVPTFPKACLTNKVADCYKSSSFKAPFEQAPENPLFKFKFPKGADKDVTTVRFYDGNWNETGRREYEETQRYPSLTRPSKPETVAEEADKSFKEQEINNPELGIPDNLLPKERRNLSERVAYLLQAYQRYGPVSYNTYQGSPVGPLQKPEIWGSFEDIHNSVHGDIGGGGHMSYPNISAFDPTFWLHHTNIDRLYAIWQALHEDPTDKETFVTPQPTNPNGRGTFTQRPGYTETEDTPLYPFRKQAEGNGNSVWWTSKDVKRTENFGYAYPEVKGFQYPGTEVTRKPLQTTIRRYYSSVPAEMSRSRKEEKNAGKFMLRQSKVLEELEPRVANIKTLSVAQVPQFDVAEPDELLAQSVKEKMPFLRDLLAPDNTYLEWLVNVKAQKHAFGGRTQVHFFVGPAPGDNDPPSVWQLSPYYVGSFVTFGQDEDTACEKCREDQANELEVTGQVPLTVALLERYLAKQIDDLSVEKVEEYLKVNLHWRVGMAGGGTINERNLVPGLKIMVVSNKTTVPEDPDDPPIYDPDVTIHPSITTREGDDQGAGRGNGTGVSILEVQG